jgi:hypothetical protein
VDLVLYFGPVYITAEMKKLPWGNPTELRAFGCEMSSCSSMLGVYVDEQGRILPKLVKKLTGKDISEFRSIAFSSFSAGWYSVNRIFQIDADRARVCAHLSMDSSFGSGLKGYEAFAKEASLGQKLMVLTNTNNAANPALGILKTSRQTVKEILSKVPELSPSICPLGVPVPSGGVWRRGGLYWFDYVKPGSASNQGNDFTHGEHANKLAPLFWKSLLIPYLRGSFFSLVSLAALMVAAVWWGYVSRSRTDTTAIR